MATMSLNEDARVLLTVKRSALTLFVGRIDTTYRMQLTLLSHAWDTGAEFVLKCTVCMI